LFPAGLARTGATLEELKGVVVTHAHPDHYGLTRRIQDETDAWVGLHPAEVPQLTPRPGDAEGRISEIEAWLTACGAPPAELEELLTDRDRLLQEMSPNLPTLEVRDGQVIPDTDGVLCAVHTPGHTPGHLVFHDRSRNIVFTGDHLLPRISANVSLRPTSGKDPLGAYETSLETLRAYGDTALAAPGHEWSFDRIPTRIHEVQRHHASRLDEILAAVRAGARTTWEVAQTVTWSRPFETLNARGRRSALGETASHLVRLERMGLLQTTSDSQPGWTPR
jgi:glyoxylase-like metal-dependent hydrolase (beta-lactamase superfamily II)